MAVDWQEELERRYYGNTNFVVSFRSKRVNRHVRGEAHFSKVRREGGCSKVSKDYRTC